MAASIFYVSSSKHVCFCSKDILTWSLHKQTVPWNLEPLQKHVTQYHGTVLLEVTKSLHGVQSLNQWQVDHTSNSGLHLT